MRKGAYIYLSVLFLVLSFFACGQWQGNNPVGVTGGSENGYGLDSPWGSEEDTMMAKVVRSWSTSGRDEILVYQFNSNKSVTIETVSNGNQAIPENGTFDVDGNKIRVNMADGYEIFTYFSTNQELVSTGDKGIILYRKK